MKVIVFLITLCFTINLSHAQSILIGKGKMRWFGINLYDIELYTSSGVYELNKPLDLVIRYQLDIDRDRLISISQKEVERIGLVWREQWTEQLKVIWPSVQEDDVLSLSINDSGRSEFFYNEEKVGEIFDPEFGKNFTAIWLSPKTRAEKLRKQLIGESA